MTTPPFEPPPQKPVRDIALDVLRAAAIFLVLGRHLQEVPAGEPRWLFDAIALWRRAGWCGVDLFFVLSGFLIAGLLFKEHRKRGTIAIGRFYVRRGFKIYPPFYAFILASIVVAAMADQLVLREVFAEVFFVQSYFRGMWVHTWSLAVEEHFYILLPVLLAVMMRFSRGRDDPFRGILWVYGGVAIAALAMRIVVANTLPYHHMTHLFPTHLRIDSLLLGVALAYLLHYHRDAFIARLRPLRAWLIALGAAMFIPTLLMPLETPFIHTIGFTLCAMGGAMILAGSTLTPLPPWRWLRGIAFIGRHSYSIYLWHLAVMVALERGLGDRLGFLPQSAVYMVASIVLGIVMARVVEVPVLALRDRMFPSRA